MIDTVICVIPKTGQPGKWRLILDLSSPHGLSVNDGIDPDQFSLQYIKFDDVVTMVTKLGRGALMSKFDVHKLLPPTHETTYQLRQNRRFDIPNWSTNRFRDTFIMASAINNGC